MRLLLDFNVPTFVGLLFFYSCCFVRLFLKLSTFLFLCFLTPNIPVSRESPQLSYKSLLLVFFLFTYYPVNLCLCTD